MKKVLLPAALALLAGCDTAGVNVEFGRFTAALSGALEVAVEGEAGFALGSCAFVALDGGERLLTLADNCVTSEGHVGPREGRFAVSPVYLGGYNVTYRAGPDGPYYRGVAGEVEIVDRRGRGVEGRFTVEAKPVDDAGRVIEGAAPVTIRGEFDARGYELLD